jgi:peptidyl-dipeptidase A
MNARLEPADIAYGRAEWRLNTTGDDEARIEVAAERARWMRLFSDDGEFERVAVLREAGSDDPVLARQIEVLYNFFLEYRFAPEGIERIAALEAETIALFNTYRGEIDGRKVSSNDIEQILIASVDEAERHAAWEASKGVGPVVADRIRELARLRNETARRAGFRDYYALQLAAQEIDEGWLFGTLGRLADLTEAPFRRRKADLDAQIAARMACTVEDLWPWHYADPFFQERANADGVDLDPFFESADVEALTLATYKGLGFDIRDILERSDLYEREGKDQHAFCVNIGRSGDVRVLCNLRPTARWMETNLHEFGHAVYDKYIDGALPYLLRGPAHTNCTEAVAMLMGRLPSTPEWLAEVRGIGRDEAVRLGDALHEHASLGMLLLVRWCLVMSHFERDLYADPDRTDLNALWWDYVERFQQLTRPEGRSAPDWAAKIHLALAPVYYHNYMIGELIASQLQHRIDADAGGLVNSPAAGAFLRDRLFGPGALRRWDETVAHVTGEPLTVDHFTRQFVDQSRSR